MPDVSSLETRGHLKFSMDAVVLFQARHPTNSTRTLAVCYVLPYRTATTCVLRTSMVGPIPSSSVFTATIQDASM